jgi:hypothetical protein
MGRKSLVRVKFGQPVEKISEVWVNTSPHGYRLAWIIFPKSGADIAEDLVPGAVGVKVLQKRLEAFRVGKIRHLPLYESVRNCFTLG